MQQTQHTTRGVALSPRRHHRPTPQASAMRRVVIVGVMAVTIPGALMAQGTQRASTRIELRPESRADGVPREYRPPAHLCRVWIDGVPPAQQPAPTDCATAVQKKPANARVIYGEDNERTPGADRQQPSTPPRPAVRKEPPLIPPDIEPVDPRVLRAEREAKRITDAQLFGDPVPAAPVPPQQPASGAAPQSAGGYVTPSGVFVGPGGISDPRYFNGNPTVRPPGTGSGTCLDRDGDGWCDDTRYGPPVCLDKDKDGRCDDLPAFASRAYPQVLPLMREVLDVLQGRPSTEVMTWLGTNEFSVRVPDQGRGGVPWRALFVDQTGELLQVWTDANHDGRADRVEIFRNGQRVKLIQR